jgi:hypothetical protein
MGAKEAASVGGLFQFIRLFTSFGQQKAQREAGL